jgi:hypothetical protein
LMMTSANICGIATASFLFYCYDYSIKRQREVVFAPTSLC